MSKIYNHIYETIGRTPLVKINKLSAGLDATILAKLESFNPFSSVKDRIGLALIQDAEDKGVINDKTVIIEPTSGNTGVGLAFVCASKGYKLKLVMPDTMSIERRKILKALGADLVLTDGSKGMKGAVDEAERMVAELDNAFMPQQFNNPANSDIHRRTTGPEIWADTDGKVDIFIAGIGTGGTISGVGEFLKEKNPSIQVIGIEPDKSPVLSAGTSGAHKIQGIGAGFVPKILNRSVMDEIILVDQDMAGQTARLLAKQEGILVGISSGAALWAALEVAKRPESKGKTIVVILPDHGERYLSTWLFNN